uniref:2S albumin n=1 Tax=Ficus pumila var. awkeotsang TaxID=204231 RepID=Q71HN1_FICPW|nr:2S albumin [Ficus pumila var. awkeotsang]
MAMAKLAALVAALLLVAHAASAFRTIITIDEADSRSREGGGGGSQQCQQEIQQRNLNHCMRYMMEQQRGRRGYNNNNYNNDGVEEEIELNQDHYNQCCNELRMIRDEQCRCEGLQMEMEREMQQGKMRPQDMREMLPTAQRLPNMCGMRPSQCQFHMPSY